MQGLQAQANAGIVPLPGAHSNLNIVRSLQYLPQALQFVAHNCKHLEQLTLRLAQCTNHKRGGAWDHPSLLKRPQFNFSQFCDLCPKLQSLTLLNVPSRY